MPLQRNDFIPQNMLSVYTSPSGLTDVRTGLPYQMGGMQVGIYFDLTEAEAQAQSTNLHEGRYRFVQIDSGSATASNIKQGTIGLMRSLAKGVNVITSYDAGLSPNVRPVVFLAPVTSVQVAAGVFLFIQEQGDASVLMKTPLSNGAPAVGDILNSVTLGLVDDPSSQTVVGTYLGVATQVPLPNQLCRMLFDAPQIQG